MSHATIKAQMTTENNYKTLLISLNNSKTTKPFKPILHFTERWKYATSIDICIPNEDI